MKICIAMFCSREFRLNDSLSIWQQTIVTAGNGKTYNKGQTIILSINDPVHLHIQAPPGLKN